LAVPQIEVAVDPRHPTTMLMPQQVELCEHVLVLPDWVARYALQAAVAPVCVF
jgi:hypothetical protein